tara:strand:+ start:2003 stop:2287 length:285 start_codon:yes stop_codon:yes gene_type:complete
MQIKFMQLEKHHVSVRKGMVATTEDWEGNEVISEGDLRSYLEEGTTGDDDKDNICLDQVLEAECVTDTDEDWISDRKGYTEVEYYAVGEEFESQ